MTEKKKVYFVNENMTKEEIYKVVKKSGYTRFPVLNDDDKVVGILNVKDLIVNRKDKFNLKDHIRKPINLKSNTIIDDAFLLLNSKREGMAIVVDDNKEFIGVVTLEDILESVVGNIFDEYDKTGSEVVEFGASSIDNLVKEKDNDSEII
jgi:putative hemolysin